MNPPSALPTPRQTHFLALALLILLFTAALRIVGAGGYPLWTDEGWSVWATSGGLVGTLTTVAGDRHPPLYFLLLDLGRALFGESRLGLRFLSITSGLIAAAVVLRLGADAFGRRAGVFAGVLFAALPIAVYYTQELRPYGWLTACIALSWWLWLRLWNRPTHGRAAAYGLAAAAALYMNYFAAFPLAMQAAIAAGSWLRQRRRSTATARYLLFAYGLAFALYLPWLLVIAAVQWPILQSGISGFPGTLGADVFNLYPTADVLFGAGAALFVGLTLIGLHRLPARGWALAAGGVGLLVILFVLATRFNFLAARTLVMLTPLLVLVPGLALARMPARIGLIAAGVFVLFSLPPPVSSVNTVEQTPSAQRQIQGRLPADRLAAALVPEVAPGDVIVLETGWDDHALAYELGRAVPHAAILSTIAWTDRFRPQPVVPQVEAALAATQRTWVIQWLQAPQVMPFLTEGGLGYRQVQVLDISAGNYGARFGAAAFDVRLFARPDLASAPVVYLEADGTPLFALRDAIFTTPDAVGRLIVDLWWEALATPALDYSVGVYALAPEGTTAGQSDQPPGDLPTSQWQPGTLYHDRHIFIPSIPDSQIGVSVYWYGDNVPLLIAGGTPGDTPYARLE